MSLAKNHVSLQYGLSFVSFLGILASGYALLVELYKDNDPTYTPLCDISSSVSCTKAFMSSWGRGFGIVGPLLGENHWLNQNNPVFGLAFYVILLLIGTGSSKFSADLCLALAVLSNISSIYLAYLLAFKIHSFCVVCVAMYFINAVLLVLSVWRRRIIVKMGWKKKN